MGGIEIKGFENEVPRKGKFIFCAHFIEKYLVKNNKMLNFGA